VFKGETWLVRLLAALVCWGLPALALSGFQYDTAAQELAWRWPRLVRPVLESVILASVGPLLGRGLKGPKI